MKSSTFNVVLAFFVFSILLVEASPFNALPHFGRRNGLQRKGAAKGTGPGATKTAAGTRTGKTSAGAGIATTSVSTIHEFHYNKPLSLNHLHLLWFN
jgi:hypothetical protein